MYRERNINVCFVSFPDCLLLLCRSNHQRPSNVDHRAWKNKIDRFSFSFFFFQIGPKCNKSVYAAEEVQAAGKKFHKFCFKCGLCKKLLEPLTMSEHEGDLFCKQCYARKYGFVVSSETS